MQPRKWTSQDGGARLTYDPEEIVAAIANASTEVEIYLSGLESEGTATISCSRWPRVKAEAASIDHPDRIRKWLDDIAAFTDILMPDLSVVCTDVKLPQLANGQPTWDSDSQRTAYLRASCIPLYNEYYRTGPTGLGTRTVFGPNFVKQFGHSFLLQTPAFVTELTWGGVMIDLVEEPWAATSDKLDAAWTASMEHLRGRHIFATCEIDEVGKFIEYPHKGASAVIAGVLPKET
jgi:hypothetical protein